MKSQKTINKKALIFSNQGLSPLHLGYELEIIDNLFNKGYSVFSVNCENVLTNCFFNPTHNLLACSICQARTTQNHKHFNSIIQLNLKKYKVEIALENFNSLEELVELKYEDLNIGRGIASSIISLFREYDLKKIKRVNEIILEQRIMVVNTLINFKNFIAKYKPDEVYLFNGRFAEIYALCKLCEKLNITYKTYDTGSNRLKYSLRENSSVHNIKQFQNDMKILENSVDNDLIIEEATALYNKRMKGDQGEVYNFLTLQENDKLPLNFDSTKKNIAIFNSSEDEMKVVEDWQFGLYKNQNDAIKTLLTKYKNDESIHFYLRVHPNLLNIENSQTKEIESFKFKNFTIIGPDKPVDTYALIKSCNKTICFGSTVGLEASFLNKVSILLGNSFYQGLGCVYEPKTYEELFALVENESLLPKKSFNIFLYLYNTKHAGIVYNNFVFDGIKNSTYKGVLIKRIYFRTVLNLFKYLNNIFLWSKMTKLILGENISLKNMMRLKSHTNDKTHLIK